MLELDQINLPSAAIGYLKITTQTWIKSTTASAITLDMVDKYQVFPGQLVPFYQRLADKDSHYNVMIRVGGELKSLYAYRDHAGLEMKDEIRPDLVGGESSVSSFVASQIEKLTSYCKPGEKPNLNTPTNYYSQRDNYTMPHRTCNSTSNAMYLDWLRRVTGRLGLGGDDDYLSTLLSIGDSPYHENQTAALLKYGWDTEWVGSGAESQDRAKVCELLDAGIPVVANILHRGSIDSPTGGHVVLLCTRRKSEGTYIAQDPYGTLSSNYSNTNGRYSIISPRDFNARWQGGYRILAV